MAKAQNTITEREENLLIKWFEQAVEQLRTEIRRVEDKIAIHMAQNDKEHAEIIAQNNKAHNEIIAQNDKMHAELMAQNNKEHTEIIAQNDKEHAEIIAQNDREHAEIKEMIRDLKTTLWAITGIIIGLMAVGFTTIGIILPLILRG